MSPEDLRQLLERAKGGDRDAWSEVFSRLGDLGAEGATVLAMARRLLPRGDPARNFVESQDLMQSALRCGWLDLNEFRGDTPGEFLAWMRSILRARLSRVIRRKRPRTGFEAAEAEAAARPHAGESLPLAQMVREEVRERVLQEVETLPDDQSAVMRLRLQGLKATDIAAMLDLKAATVRKRESRAMERLREALKPTEET